MFAGDRGGWEGEGAAWIPADDDGVVEVDDVGGVGEGAREHLDEPEAAGSVSSGGAPAHDGLRGVQENLQPRRPIASRAGGVQGQEMREGGLRALDTQVSNWTRRAIQQEWSELNGQFEARVSKSDCPREAAP